MKEHLWWCNKDRLRFEQNRKSKTKTCEVCGEEMAYVGYTEVPGKTKSKKGSATVEETAHLNEQQIQESNGG